jgi:hypothetical protein
MGTAVPNSSQLSQFLREYCVSGVSVGVATVCTNPIGSPYMFMQLNMLYAHICACVSMPLMNEGCKTIAYVVCSTAAQMWSRSGCSCRSCRLVAGSRVACRPVVW